MKHKNKIQKMEHKGSFGKSSFDKDHNDNFSFRKFIYESWLFFKWIFWVLWILESGVYFYSCYMIIIILGLIWHPFWYGLLLTYFVYMSNTLNKVLKALLNPYKQILETFGLLVGIIYLFTIIYYVFYHEDFPNNTCHSIWYCWITNID